MASLMPEKNMFVVRHLKREDQSESLMWNKTLSKIPEFLNNPMLVLNIDEDREAKKYIDNVLDKTSKTEFKYIISSPFLRCIQTAELIRQSKEHDKIFVHFGLSELIDDLLFPQFYGFGKNRLENPFFSSDGMDVNKVFEHTQSYVKDSVPMQLLEDSVSYNHISYETDKSYDERVRKVMNEIFGKFDGNILIVTHNYALRWNGNKSLEYGELYPVTFSMSGGGYYSKYLKYKQKYLTLKNKY